MIPFGDGRSAVGHCIGVYEKNVYVVVVFAGTVSDEEPASARQAWRSGIEFVAITLDAKVYVGDWSVVANDVPAHTAPQA
ncbi:hypothetical protein GCM10025868_15040 [Angustibacter aerolatus]|uniref:Uncharacterized protein n=1 Tax=Angustibacter aerolatus TaxID=1162965 RepID=A0ABQ6JGK5_9ACTN|nr:hypothetical protein [Angustibacter aerolatus]GMA86254.1 hypothetical protein GCM10025868_15040 [Angustibacter aerolatus]